MEISVPCDEEGYVDLQCHLCGEHFKLLVQDINDESNIDIWCPYCGLNGQIYASEDVEDVALRMAVNEMNSMIFNAFKDMEKSMKHNKYVKFTAGKKPKDEELNTIKSKVDNLEIKHYKCCGTTAKIKPLAIETGSYCPICGGIDYE